MNFLKAIFTWWNGATLGTRFFTWRKGQEVGTDEQGNRYFEEKAPKPGQPSKRWVIYNGTAEASRVPPDWHGWLHHTFEEPPTKEPFHVKPWESEHIPNLTGTPHAYRPKGSIHREGRHAPTTGDYEAWAPDA